MRQVKCLCVAVQPQVLVFRNIYFVMPYNRCPSSKLFTRWSTGIYGDVVSSSARLRLLLLWLSWWFQRIQVFHIVNRHNICFCPHMCISQRRRRFISSGLDQGETTSASVITFLLTLSRPKHMSLHFSWLQHLYFTVTDSGGPAQFPAHQSLLIWCSGTGSACCGRAGSRIIACQPPRRCPDWASTSILSQPAWYSCSVIGLVTPDWPTDSFKLNGYPAVIAMRLKLHFLHIMWSLSQLWWVRCNSPLCTYFSTSCLTHLVLLIPYIIRLGISISFGYFTSVL